jgi:hypothetical protein
MLDGLPTRLTCLRYRILIYLVDDSTMTWSLEPRGASLCRCHHVCAAPLYSIDH